MAILQVLPTMGQGLEYDYTPKFHRYNGFYMTNPVLRAIINGIADAETTSWQVKGRNARSATRILDDVTGHGKQTFKTLNNTGSKVGMIGGEELYEIIRSHGEPANFVLLDPNNVVQHVKNGKTQHYKDNYSGHTWQPEDVIHIPNNPCGPEPHGYSDIAPMENLLLSLMQLWDDTGRIFHRYIKPMHLVYLNTDIQSKIDDFTVKWVKTRETPEQDMILPKDIVDSIEKVSIPQGSSLNPMEYERLLIQRILQSYRYPELALGTGSVNSEESARMLYSGLRQLVRWRQQYREEMWEVQLLRKMWPGTESPKMSFTFAAEPEEEQWKRWAGLFGQVNASNLSDQLKAAMYKKIFREMKIL